MKLVLINGGQKTRLQYLTEPNQYFFCGLSKVAATMGGDVKSTCFYKLLKNNVCTKKTMPVYAKPIERFLLLSLARIKVRGCKRLLHLDVGSCSAIKGLKFETAILTLTSHIS